MKFMGFQWEDHRSTTKILRPGIGPSFTINMHILLPYNLMLHKVPLRQS